MILIKLGYSLVAIFFIVICAAFWVAWHSAERRETIDDAFPAIGQFITVSGARVHYKTSGTGPDIVLIHGASGNLREWEFGLRAALEGRFTVTAFDRPGHGHSDAIAGGDHLAAQAAHLHSALLALGIRTPVLVGHSYGGAVAMAMALAQPPKSLVLIAAPTLPWPGRLDISYRITSDKSGRALIAPLAGALVPQSYVRRATVAVFAPQSPPDAYLTDFGAMLAVRAPSLAANFAQVNALRGDIVAQQAGYGALNIPVELIHGTADITVPLMIHSQPLSQILPNARLTVLDGLGHMPHHADLDAVLAAILRAAGKDTNSTNGSESGD